MTHLWPVCWWPPLWLYTPPWGQWLTYDLSVGDDLPCDCILPLDGNDSPMTCLLVMAISVTVYSPLMAKTHLWPVCWWWPPLWLYTPPWGQWLTYDVSVGDGYLCDCILLLEDNDSPMTCLLVMATSVTVYSSLRTMTHLWPVCWWWLPLWLYTPPWGQWLTYDLSVGVGYLCDCILPLEDNDSPMTCLLVMATSVTVYSSLRAMTHLWPVCWWWLPLWLYTPPWGQRLTYDPSVGVGYLCDCILPLEDNDSPMTCLLVMATSVTVYSPLRTMTHLWPVCWCWLPLWLYTPPWGQWLTYDLSVGVGYLCDCILLLEDNDSPMTCLLVMATSVTVYSSLRAMTHLWPVCWWWSPLWLYTPPWGPRPTKAGPPVSCWHKNSG